MFLSASIITALTLFAVGALRYFVTGKKWIISGLEMMVTGGLSAAVAYLVGFIFKAVFNVQV
jgi:VIT1/CCC1 family predicted Fe2+/Mn2+ transporter